MTDVTNRYELLTSPLLLVRNAERERRELTLPGVLAALVRGEVRDFPALRPHQRHAWHAFLVQLGAIALHQASNAEPSEDEEGWKRLLLTLTVGSEEPWSLIVPDLSRPAFLQPPVPEGNLKRLKDVFESPEQFDILVTSKNHDVKACRMRAPTPEHWVFGLVSLQTMQGFSGRQSYGIARMNSGYGNRPGVSFASDEGVDLGSRFRRDLAILLEVRDELVKEFGYCNRSGHALLWLEPWDGNSSLSLAQCDPYFIEICRRVRLTADDNRMVARYVSTKVARLDAASAKGNTGDPWTPVDKKEGKALSVSARGFDYRLTQELLLSSDWRPGFTQKIVTGDDKGSGKLAFVAAALARGQGKTEGLHERVLPIPARVKRWLAKPDEQERIATLAERRVVEVDEFQRKVLRPALCYLFQAGPRPQDLDLRDERPRPFIAKLNADVDALFFERLWEDIGVDGHEAQKRWADVLCKLGERILNAAIEIAPLPVARRYRAIAVATSVFHGAKRKLYPELFDPDLRENDDATSGEAANDQGATV
jgi:CRISPR system Cascade subunit CasA